MEPSDISNAQDSANEAVTLRDIDALIERGEYAAARAALDAGVARGRMSEVEAAGRTRRIAAFDTPDQIPAAAATGGVAAPAASAAGTPYLRPPLRMAFAAAGVFFAFRALLAVPIYVDAVRHGGGWNSLLAERRTSVLFHSPPTAALDTTTVGGAIGEDLLRFGPASWACFAAVVLGKRPRTSPANTTV